MQAKVLEAVRTHWPWSSYRKPEIPPKHVEFLLSTGKPDCAGRVTSRYQSAHGPVAAGYRIELTMPENWIESVLNVLLVPVVQWSYGGHYGGHYFGPKFVLARTRRESKSGIELWGLTVVLQSRGYSLRPGTIWYGKNELGEAYGTRKCDVVAGLAKHLNKAIGFG